MNKEKQIEEMANIITTKAFEQAHLIDGDENLADIVATELYEKGYRKASEVAREIFVELDKRLDDITIVMGRLDSLRTFHKTMEKVTAEVAELKKKYTEGGE